MNEVLQEQITQNFVELLNWAKGMAEVANEQVPILIEEIINFYTVQYCAYLLGSLICLIIVYMVYNKPLREAIKITNFRNIEDEKEREIYCEKLRNDEEVSYYVFSVITIVVAGFTSIVLFANSFIDLIKITIAPRLWIIEYLSSLVQ
jgi:hypothetical protein